MHSLLSRGLNFCPTPGEPEPYELWCDLIKFHFSLCRKLFFDKRVNLNLSLDSDNLSSLNTPTEPDDGPFDHNQFRNPSTWCPIGPINLEAMIAFNEANLAEYTPKAPGNHNLTLNEKRALAELSNNTDIVIKPADKGSAVVVMDRIDYITEGLRQLSNTNHYRETKTDLTDTHKQEIHNLIQELLDSKDISDKCANYLCTKNPRTPQLYLLPKIHKNQTPVPGRPIVSANNSPTERISQWTDFFLQPIVSHTPSYVRDTSDFINKISEGPPLLEGTILCTIDVSSLYTNIPIQEGITACAKYLQATRNNNSPPSNGNIVRTLDYVLTKNNFDFNDRHYLQVGGTAMGTKVAPSFANLFMADFEEKWVYTYPVKPSIWLRYIDDIFLIWEHSLAELEVFIKHLNDCHPTIKFTSEHSYNHVNFLDTTVHLTPEGTLYTDLYCKPTDSHNYLVYDSAHPGHCKKGLPYSQFLRLRRICQRLSDFDKNATMLASHFYRRGYPLDLIEDSLIRARRHDREELLHPTPKNNASALEKLFIIDTYHPGQSPLKDIVTQNWPILGRTNTTDNLYSKEIIFGHRRNKNLRDLLVKAQLPSKQTSTVENTTPMHTCSTKNCRYCPALDHSGCITSSHNGRTYNTRKYISCKSNNLIYCITCKTCQLQYVGQTKNRLMDRFSMHFVHSQRDEDKSNKGRKAQKSTKAKKQDPIGRHFQSTGHNGPKDMIIHILEFISAPSESPPGQYLRNETERKWIHRLQTISPLGLNTMEWVTNDPSPVPNNFHIRSYGYIKKTIQTYQYIYGYTAPNAGYPPSLSSMWSIHTVKGWPIIKYMCVSVTLRLPHTGVPSGTLGKGALISTPRAAILHVFPTTVSMTVRATLIWYNSVWWASMAKPCISYIVYYYTIDYKGIYTVQLGDLPSANPSASCAHIYLFSA